MAINSTGDARRIVYDILIGIWTDLFPQEPPADALKRLLLPNNRVEDGMGEAKYPKAPPSWARVAITGTRSTPASIGNTDFFMSARLYVDIFTEADQNMQETDRIATAFIEGLIRSGREVMVESAFLKEQGSDREHFVSRVQAELKYEMHYQS